jgi:hypothetical protein
MRWISSSGGPLVLLPSSIQKRWSGAVRASSTSVSDYDAACAVRGYVGTIARHSRSILVLNDEPMDTTTIQTGPRCVVLVRWIYGPSRTIVEEELRHLTLHTASELQRLAFTASERISSLIDSAELGASAAECERIEIVPGDYIVRVLEHAPSSDYETDPLRRPAGARAPVVRTGRGGWHSAHERSAATGKGGPSRGRGHAHGPSAATPQ